MAQALDLGVHEHVSIVGGGGKTTVLHALGDQLNGSVVLTCTTKMGHDQHRGRPVLLDPSPDELVDAATGQPVMVWKRIQGQKAVGVSPEACDEWFSRVDHVVIEADGSRRRPFKAPADYEPVVPGTTTTMVSVIGADALGRVIADQCHRPLRVAALAECSAYERLSPRAAATVLTHERGALKECPADARFVVVVTKVDDATREMVDEMASAVVEISPGTGVVLLASSSED
ncbi:MAG: selenium cofactor biosynthesis protein YqeC [Acidimicrobiales bacterium]